MSARTSESRRPCLTRSHSQTHRMGSMFQGEKVQNSTGGKPAASNFYKEEDKNENDGPMGKALDFCTNLCFKSSPLAMIVNKIRKN